MQNVGLTFMLGMGQALAAGIGGMDSKGDVLKTPSVTPSPNTPGSGGMTQGNFMPSMPNYVGVGANPSFQGYY